MIISLNKNYFRPILENYGLWDHCRVDGGLEFSLIYFVQDMLRDFRHSKTREPWIRTKSTDVSSTCLVLVTWTLG